ncbi:MAG: prepilin-type N-terminal cleavage/methylation domain-containing protein [Planctomycetes bacterium]|nr:prepilin-type N-terminal cleavage/methylation domain-containing protein [Planctomycetota bacterium]
MRRSGFTLVELMMSLAVLAILAALAVPLIGDTDALRLDAAERLLTSDLEHTQILAITHPEDAYGLVIHENGTGWHIALISDPEIPVLETNSDDPLTLTVGEGRGRPAEGVSLSTNAADNIIAFDSTGGLADFTLETSISLIIGESDSALLIAASTGTISYE